MTKLEAMQDAQKYADTIKATVYVLRRGKDYKSSRNENRGWRVAELVIPTLQTGASNGL